MRPSHHFVALLAIAADYVARAMSNALGKALGQPILVDNKPGNGSIIAAGIASPEQFASFLVKDGKLWVGLVKSANAEVE